MGSSENENAESSSEAAIGTENEETTDEPTNEIAESSSEGPSEASVGASAGAEENVETTTVAALEESSATGDAEVPAETIEAGQVPISSTFHERIFVQTYFLKLFLTYILALKFFLHKNIGAKAAH